MTRTPFLFAALGGLALAACGPAEVVVTAEIQVEDPATGEQVSRTLRDLEVQLLPYDRDVIFDSLTNAATEPEPPIPDELLAAQQQTAEAQRQWRELENRWNTLRDTLQKINTAIGQFSRGESRYVVLFREFQDMEGQLRRVEGQKDRAFARFDSLTKANIQRAQAYRLRHDEWADVAFAEVDPVMLAHLRASRLDAVVDTTDAQGVARVQLRPGDYWVHARYEEPYSELYWNVPLTVTRGAPVALTLDRSNAEQRPKF
jgi:hypothetical protein